MSVEYKDYYKILGVKKGASKDEIAKAYKKLARKHHPDLNPNDQGAEERFKDIGEAYEVLKDPEKRKLYDSLGPNWKNGQNFQPPPGRENVHFDFQGGNPFGGGGFSSAGDFSSFFESIFGPGGFGGGGFGAEQRDFGGSFERRRSKGADVQADLKLTLEEAHRGGTKAITLAEASGEDKTLQVSIPRGIKEGKKIRLAGGGRPGRGGGPAGDLYLKIKIIPHHQFALEGENIVYDLFLAPWEAVLGASVRVPTLDGSVDMNIPAGINSGQKLRIKGKGLTSAGDQFVRVRIKSPAKLTEEERELWEELAEISSFHPRKPGAQASGQASAESSKDSSTRQAQES